MSPSTALWQDLFQYHKSLGSIYLKDLFKQDKDRFSKFSLRVGKLLLDYSKQRVTEETIVKLCQFAKDLHLEAAIQALFSGKVVNFSEQKAALHVALRDPTLTPLIMQGEDIKSEIRSVLNRIEDFVTSFHRGDYIGSTGKTITSVVSLGIGGSDLGPSMVSQALYEYKVTDVAFHFISNVDGKTLFSLLSNLDPASTLCIINSKTFTTPETLQNAASLKTWFSNALGLQNAMQHLIGVTANPARAESFGILRENIFEFWDFIGGRYSVWSSVGLPIALQLGMSQFKDFLQGANEMDRHFLKAPFSENMPVLMALLGVWNINCEGYSSHAVIPYDDNLREFPLYLQQLEMESNGKKASSERGFVAHATAPIIWGGVGCNGQHAYMQLLHQGSHIVPVDFLLGVHGHPEFLAQHRLLVASCLSQSKALMEGTKEESLADDPLREAKLCLGNRPSNTLLYPKLTPYLLGSLIALYEHKVFVQGILWGVNSFDQWGVELGKKLAKEILPYLEDKDQCSALDSSTEGLIQCFREYQ